MATLAPGTLAPDFVLPASGGGAFRLSEHRGRKVVLFFYPKDNTPGCTREACDFRDHYADLTGLDVVLVGISKDSLASHLKFTEAYQLPFPLLTDANSEVASAYGAFGEKTMYGKKVMGTIRTTVLVDEKGLVARSWSPVKVEGHAAAVLAALRA